MLHSIAEKVGLASPAEQKEDVIKEKGKLSIQHVYPRRDESRKMLAAEWQGARSVKVKEVGLPLITEPRDAIVQMTTVTICGSDLHMYYDEVPPTGSMQKGDILGHEGVGIVMEVGPECKKFKPGDRVVISAVIACGECEWCQKQQPSLCDTTNPSKTMEELYGHRLAGIFGYSHLTGGYPGMQEEFVRVPIADVNLLKLPATIPDSKAIFLSDVLCTGWHGNELGEVGKDKNVVIWGCGPVGLMTAFLAKHRGAKRVISIDGIAKRLQIAQQIGAETINYNEHSDVVAEIFSRMPGGPDVAIDCVGYRFCKTTTHKLQRVAKMETDAPEVIDEMVRACKKGGNLVMIGDYFGYANQYPIGPQMEKGFTCRGGQVFVQKYWETLLQKMVAGEIDPTFELTTTLDFENIEDAYRRFAEERENHVKMLLKTKFGREYKLPEKGEASVETRHTPATVKGKESVTEQAREALAGAGQKAAEATQAVQEKLGIGQGATRGKSQAHATTPAGKKGGR